MKLMEIVKHTHIHTHTYTRICGEVYLIEDIFN